VFVFGSLGGRFSGARSFVDRVGGWGAGGVVGGFWRETFAFWGCVRGCVGAPRELDPRGVVFWGVVGRAGSVVCGFLWVFLGCLGWGWLVGLVRGVWCFVCVVCGVWLVGGGLCCVGVCCSLLGGRGCFLRVWFRKDVRGFVVCGKTLWVFGLVFVVVCVGCSGWLLPREGRTRFWVRGGAETFPGFRFWCRVVCLFVGGGLTGFEP